jgi:hypothetical protein
MVALSGLSGWLRHNSEHYLMEAAQRDVAARHLGRPVSLPPAGLSATFWRHVFVPVYRRLPWRLRSRIIALMPGSHRQEWARRPPLQR